MTHLSPKEQSDMIASFLAGTVWENTKLISLSADMGLRRYYSLTQNNETVLLMDMIRSGILETGLGNYIRIAEYLRSCSIRVPEIYHHDSEGGLAVIEKTGRSSFGDQIRKSHNPKEIYGLATDILVEIKNKAKENHLSLAGYEDTLIYKRLGQFVDYYMSATLGHRTVQKDHQEFHNVLKQIEKKLPPCPMGFCHADFHLENLMWMDNPKDQYAVIDFQDAFWGFQGYDLLNLLEDARQTVPDDIKQEMKARYSQGISEDEKGAFDQWYVFMSAQFHLRVIGLFIKFAYENDGLEFLEHIPRLQNYIKDHLKDPMMAPLKEWLEDKEISLDVPLEELEKR